MTASAAEPSSGGQSTPTGPPPLPPYHTGMTGIVVGVTVVWFAGFVVLLFFIDQLRVNGAMVWLWTCLAGGALGLLGLAIYQWQRSAALRGHRGAQTSALE